MSAAALFCMSYGWKSVNLPFTCKTQWRVKEIETEGEEEFAKESPAQEVHKTAGPSNLTESMNVQSHTSTPPRSTRNRINSVNLEDYEIDNIDTEDADLMRQTYRPATIKVENNPSQDEQSSPMQEKRTRDTISLPWREALRPRKSTIRHSSQDSEDQECTEEEDDRNKGEARDEGEEDEVDEVEEEGEEGKEQEGRRWYALQNRTEARSFSLEKEEKQRLQSPPRKVLHKGMGIKNAHDARRGGSRAEKHRCAQRVDDSDDSLLVDEMDQGPIGSSSWMHHLDGDTKVDETVSFDDIGGLSNHIDALKEMVFFPLLYPDFFANYHISPPRGVLLCGPLGTGKTLISRALACAASKVGQKVNFYMRKGANVLSKWVGEAEQQLKLLFEEAQRNQPSIIFFDEIDGLAPVRSSKQEQIHNSIVSTLLALMDGLDSRGQLVLIGVTNRTDAIDGALRRPSQFDREFVFSLPDCKAQAEILKIHTRKWKNPLSKELRMELAIACMGYCGVDLKALCTKATINAFREKYPQIYTSDDKFVIDLDSLKVEKHDFLEAMSTITPVAHRCATVQSRPLSPVIAPCLQGQLKIISHYISDIFYVVAKGDKKDSLNDSSHHLAKLLGFPYGSSIPFFYRPRLLLCGKEGAGLDHIGPAVLHKLERFPVHCLGLPSLLSDPSARTPEEVLVHIVGEARRTTPSILYLPQLQLCYQVEKPSLDDRCRFISQLVDVVLTIPDQQVVITPKKNVSNPELPKVPKAARGPSETELHAKILGMLSQMDPALVAFCDKIAAQGGPTRLSEDSTTNFPSNPVAQPVHITRTSECLRNVQPDMNVSQSYEGLKRSKQNSDPDQGKVVAGDSDPFAEDRSQPMEIDTPGQNTL
ncbi:hypothetical protein SUGI_0169310 [Cryptomeria japonica]|nr:hypothetical protein SUGI_0169310 [Cryptomeria japonica]